MTYKQESKGIGALLHGEDARQQSEENDRDTGPDVDSESLPQWIGQFGHGKGESVGRKGEESV